MRRLKRISRLDPDIKQPHEGQCPVVVDEALKIPPLHKLHHDKIEAVSLFNGINGYDVRMI